MRREFNRVATAFTNNPENTMNTALANSIGMLLLAFKKRYFSHASEEEMNQHYADCLKALRDLSENDASRQDSIKKFIQIAQQPSNKLDRVTLYFPKEDKKEWHIFRLKDVLTLVWTALHDDKKFTHHYHGDTKEKLTRANQDRIHRIGSFFSILDKIKNDPPCHLGVRHEVVFLLNKAYEGIDLIEDAESTVLSFFKEKLHERFWEEYNGSRSAEKNPGLLDALFIWMRDANPRAILKILDPQANILSSLHQYFIEHGIQPDEIKLDVLVQAALSSLEFSCDPKVSPMLYQIDWILNAPERKDAVGDAALSRMQAWIHRDCRLHVKTDQSKVRDFYWVYRAYQDLTQHRLLLSLVGEFDGLQPLLEKCHGYLQAFEEFKEGLTFPNAPEGIADEINAFNTTLSACKEDNMLHPIENFFAQWFSAQENGDLNTQKHCYGMLLDPEIRSKIILTDKAINHFIRLNPTASEGVIEVTPYWINRIFLHAILTRVDQWSDRFARVFQHTLAFVEDAFNQENSERTRSLRQDSYPPRLRKQLAYLEACWRQAVGNTTQTDIPKRPDFMILLPQDVRNFEEWQDVSVLLDDAMLERVRSLFSWLKASSTKARVC